MTAPLLESLTDEKLTVAASQAAQHKPITDTAVKKFLVMIKIIESTASESEEQKSYDLVRMKSATVCLSLSQIFVTFNSENNDSSLSLLYAEKKINIKEFHS